MELGHILWPSDPVTREFSDPETQLTRWPCCTMNSKCRLMCEEIFSGQRIFNDHRYKVKVHCTDWHPVISVQQQTPDNDFCRLTNYELLRWLVETPSRDFAHYRLSGGRRIFTTCQELTSWHVDTCHEVSSWHVVNILRAAWSRVRSPPVH